MAAAGAAGGYGFYRWLDRAPGLEGIPRPLRKTFEFDEAVARGVFDERGLAPTYSLKHATELKINGNFGLKQKIELDSFRLQMVGVEGADKLPQYVKDVTAWEYKYAEDTAKELGENVKTRPKAAGAAPAPAPAAGAPAAPDRSAMPPEFQKAFAAIDKENDGKPQRGQEEAGESDSTLDPGTPGLLLTMDDVLKMPRHEMVTQFKCIEGWSQIVQWGGVRLGDLLTAYPPARNADGSLPKYVYMETPNGDYYTGYEMAECHHPQSLLVTEMSGKPITQEHGAPMRLHMPIKYGYKQIKRIGLIAYTDDRPDDYWTKLGYDWYAGL
ncbi:oxidoreductase molybdopterin binding protein [Granulicella tundricola MP5ACTX9]|uniref:Oxidoreductase molybdopterin binding protein n=1 Tax=Granulicella tundricola (strain ATCC BAA-1859 / DSM 23138 / MP5ACTX9) TaxID=1198114 RepID=E8WZC1_GRATM|nr:oxidoreductase molybdopterin binding protein [Granulicella tundricola MP5ACTX9]